MLKLKAIQHNQRAALFGSYAAYFKKLPENAHLMQNNYAVLPINYFLLSDVKI